MKVIASILGISFLAGCATVPTLDKSLPIGSPSKFNADPDRYDNKIIYVRAYIATAPHWWQFALYERPRRSDGMGCLSIVENGWLMENRYMVDKQFIILKGKFIKNATVDNIYGGCFDSNNGFVADVNFLRDRYGVHYQR